ncbi:MAG: VWA domain-containing protein [Bacteroidia bacterium]|nr:VWA domain-containing protein [Bacteroidia bacterium]HQV01170.1 VWA domain-containing protein [Bacteroidia bacterium]
MAGVTFANPQFFWLLLLIPAMLTYHIYVIRKRRARITFSSTQIFTYTKPTLRQRFIFLPLALRLIGTTALIIALARPQSSSSGQDVRTEGISICLAMDVSGSMLAEDFKPNRIEAVKKVALDFIDGRPNDQIGLVIFSGESFTLCPITTDHAVLKNQLMRASSEMLQDGTGIGDGLATAIARVKDAKTKSKVIILLTDGVNNSGAIAPATAGEIAKTFGIRVYAIGVGRNGTAPYPFKTPFGIQYQDVEVKIDEALLKEISAGTDAKYFRATNNNKLRDIYAEIDKLERTKIEVTEFRRYTELYWIWAAIGCTCLITELLLRYTLLRSIP